MANVIIKSSSGADITSRYDIIQSGDSITATRKVDDKMVILRDSDIISDSMHKINYNFELIENREDVNDYKLVKYSKQINDEIEKLRSRVDMNNTILSNSIDRLSGEISSSGSSADIQAKVNNAIMNANSLISDMVSSLAGQQINNALGSYVKSSELTSTLKGYITSDTLKDYVTRDELPGGTTDYVSSTAFDAFKADVASRSASASRIVSNNKLYRIDGCLVYNSNGDKPVSHVSGQKSTYETVEQVYEAIKDTIDPPNPDRKGIDDPGVSERLIAFIESTFRTVATELSLFKQEVTEDSASFDIVAAVDPDQNPETGKQVAASIFGYADKDGSKLMLNADQITLSADHKLKLETGKFTINSTNFKVKDNGDVVVKGDITATSLTLEGDAQTDINNLIQSGVQSGIQSNDTIRTALTNLISTVGEKKGWGNNNPETPDEYNDEWLTRAFNKTFSAGGLLLTGNVFVGDSNGNITAGMMGASGNTNDIRFFAGSDSTSTSSAPFRVYEDGHLYASDAEISGNVKANKFEAYGDTETFTSYDGGQTEVIWDVTRQTEMNGNQFGISSICTNDSTTGNQVSSLYITILDEYEVTQNDDPVLYSLADDYDDGENSGKRLHGIPVLCFNYKGTKFVMTPGSWKGSAISAVNTSDIYFLEESDKIYNSLVFSNNQVYYEKHTASGKDYYIYNKKYKDYIITTSDAKLYKFGYSYGNAQNEQELSAILNSYSLLRPNLYGVNVDSNYIFNSANPSNITNETAQACRNNLYTGNTYKKFSYESPKQWFNEPNGGTIDPSSLNPKIVEAIEDIFRNPNDTYGNGDGWDRGNTDIANGGGVINAMSNIEPFDADNVQGHIERSYSGAYKEQYSNGAKVDAQNPTAYVDCRYFIFIDYPLPSNMYDGSVPSVTVEWDRGSYTSSETFYVSDVHITVQFGIYAEGLTSDVPSKLENLTKTTEFSDIYKNVYIHIDVYGQSSGLQTIKLAQFETYLS